MTQRNRGHGRGSARHRAEEAANMVRAKRASEAAGEVPNEVAGEVANEVPGEDRANVLRW
jgi:hypothetical protein